MQNGIPKGAVRSHFDLIVGERIFIVDNSVSVAKTPTVRHVSGCFYDKAWFKPDCDAWLFKNYWDARAYVLKREHDRPTRNKEVPEQGTGGV